MKISTAKKLLAKKVASSNKSLKKSDLSDEKDLRDLENSLTDWNAEHNQSGRHK